MMLAWKGKTRGSESYKNIISYSRLTNANFFFPDESFMSITKHEPVGVCGAIIPVGDPQEQALITAGLTCHMLHERKLL